jgi:hypothetical protein
MMAELLLGCAGMLVTLLAFLIGFFTGRAVREQPMLPVEPQVDEEKKLRFEAEQKALADCMNYSIDVAYGGSK